MSVPDIPQLEGESWLDYARRRAEILGIELPSSAAVRADPSATTQTFDDDLIPDPGEDSPFAREREEIDAVLGRLDILSAYLKYCGKMVPDAGGKRSNIMVSCPIPGHEDKVPSADLNLDKGDGGVWHCHKCQQGGDKYDLAAWHFGFDVPGYKDGKNFPDLRRRMAEGLGYTVMVQGKDTWLEKTQPPAADPVATSQSFVAAPISEDNDATDDENPIPTIRTSASLFTREELNWRTLPIMQNKDTFLSTWMTEITQTWQPEEFYFFEGLAALGLAVGNNVRLEDEKKIRANTMICLVGKTGTGKSISVHFFEELLYEALPYQTGNGSGVFHLYASGSGEDLVNQMIHETVDPATKEKKVHPVRALMYEDEFEALMARVNRANSTLRANLMKFHDSDRPVSKSSQTQGGASAKDHYMQVLTTTQPKRLSALMKEGDASSGFLNRWLFVFGKQKYRPSISTVKVNVKPAARLLQHIRAWASPGRTVSIVADPVAFDLWDNLVQDQIRALEDTDDVLIARIEVQCKKILLLFAINDETDVINESHMRSLIAMFPYLKKCYGVVEKQVGITPLQECIDLMKNYFASHPNDDITMRMLAFQSAAKRHDSFTRSKAIELLVKLGEIEEIPRARGEKVIRWRYIKDQALLGKVLSFPTQP